ncbi:MAG: DNA-3-methyladenine glycosylase I [Clostridiaceae bacterium]|nr:DNA-3-methyladenine glycosylase I [Clostridiaceae bacterium]
MIDLTGRRVCPWASKDEQSLRYHDSEWGIPLHDEGRLFELLLLEGMQAGLSWAVVLAKRPAIRAALAGFDPHRLAVWTETEIQQALGSPGIIRNARKIRAAMTNARAWQTLIRSGSSLDQLLWAAVDRKPVINHWSSPEEVPASTDLSETLSRDLKGRGFSFVGPTICYSLMQAAGLVCDHLAWCDCHPDNAPAK